MNSFLVESVGLIMGVDGTVISWWRAMHTYMAGSKAPTGRRVPSDTTNRPINFVNNILVCRRFALGLSARLPF